jgi:CubicO group peptidase (beta-lactamase class C family)
MCIRIIGNVTGNQKSANSMFKLHSRWPQLCVLFVAISLFGSSSSLHADVTLPIVFTDNMVLQRDLPISIWGTAGADEAVSVAFAGQSVATKADADGKWMVRLKPLATSNLSRVLTVTGNNRIELNDVLVGEVWLCSGQSNMADSFNSAKSRFIEPEYFEMDLSRLRVSTRRGWEPVNEKTQKSISRVAFYFGVDLYQKLDVPIGLILRYNSGTPIQSWIPKDDSEIIRKRLSIAEGWNDVQENRNPAVQFDDKIAPIIPITFRGVIWYQGERNAKAQTGWEYRDLLPFMIDNWRELWAKRAGQPIRKFPFYYVQVPTQESPPDAEWPWLRDAMRRALDSTENAGMAVFYDHGVSLHPHDKHVAGQRLALWALAKDYGHSDLVYSGPLLDKVVCKSGKAILSFKHIGGGLQQRGGGKGLRFFEIAAEDGKYFPAIATIVDNKVVCQSPSVPKPKYVRYLFRKLEPNPEVSLINAEGLPASSFITDDFKPPREPIVATANSKKPVERTPEREAALAKKRAERRAAKMKGETANSRANRSKAKPNETEPNSTKPSSRKSDSGFATLEANGLAPEIVDLSAKDISYAKEQHIPDLKQPFISTTPEDLGDGVEVAALGEYGGDKKSILAFADEIAAGKHGEVDSFLIYNDGRLVFESYYRRGRRNYPHYQMSITKSYTAMAIGRAIQLDHLTMADLDKPVVGFLKDVDRSKLAPGADSITLNQAMNMRSGVRVSKQKISELRKSAAALQGQGQIQAYLQHTQPITAESKQFKYQGCDPAMAMQVLEVVVPGSARNFIETELLGKMGIKRYGWQNDVSGLPKSAAGSSMRSRDMIKWGMLTQNGGQWNGEQLIPSDFVDRATGKLHTNPQATSYGYFWWRHDMKVGDQICDCKSGRGAGGQFILMLDELDLIFVVTSHTKGMGGMMKSIAEEVLPAFLK